MKNKKISFIGGDLITVYLINMFLEEKYEVKVYGMDGAYDLIKISESEKQKIFSYDINEALEFSDNIILAMPFHNKSNKIISAFNKLELDIKDIIDKLKNKKVISGKLTKGVIDSLEKQNTQIFNLNEDNEIRIANAIGTAEACIQIVANEIDQTIHGTNILVLGFGRLGKIISNKFKVLNANICTEARKTSDLAWIKAMGIEAIDLKDLDKNLNRFDVIINTIPYKILDEERIKLLKDSCFVVDLSDEERGVDEKAAREHNIKSIWALSLPEKTAPKSYALSIKESIKKIISEDK